jgi:hypothetical protein
MENRENITFSANYYEFKKHNPRFDEGCSDSSDKFQQLQDPREKNGDNVNNTRREARRHFRNKKREYLKGKIDELAKNSKYKNIRDLCIGIDGFQMGYQIRRNLVKDENGDLLPDSRNIVAYLRRLLLSNGSVNTSQQRNCFL